MKIKTKISLAIGALLALSMGLHLFTSWRDIRAQSLRALEHEAENVRGILMATRRVYQLQFLASGLPVNEKTVGFLPAHALSRIAADFPSWHDSGLRFNAVSDRPRNPDNRADADEVAAMDWFRAHPEAKKRIAEITDRDGKPWLHYASPLYIEPYCMSCHGDPADAPPGIRDVYKEAWGYQIGELRGILSVRLPMSHIDERVRATWLDEFIEHLIGYAVLFFVLAFLLDRFLTRRLLRLERTTAKLAQGDYSERSRQEGEDEVSSLARAIDRMADAVQERDRSLVAREQKIASILKTAPIPIGIASGRTLIEGNNAFATLLGCSPSELPGLEATDLYEDASEHERVGKEIERQFAAKGRCTVFTHWRTPDGRLRDVVLHMSPLVIPDTPDAMIVSALDVTERNRIDAELREHQEHLEDLVDRRTRELTAALDASRSADLAKDQFLANVSHELRTPLNAVLGMSAIARRMSHDPQQIDCLEKVDQAGKMLAHLIDDLLDLSKIVAGKMEFRQIPFSLRQIVERSNSVLAYRAAEKGLELHEHIDAEVPEVLVGDPLRIEQILLNLTTNALKFTDAGHVEVRLGVVEREEDRICLSIEVEDTGIGMQEQDIARLFQPFSQIDAGIARRHGGTGLGLALCKRFAERMGGGITVQSQPGVGSTFRVTLWLREGDPDALLQARVEDATPATLPARYRNAHVLVVEDQPINREIVEALLDELGIVSRMADNGQEALDILATSGPDAFDLVLMDIQMPVLDGLSATRLLRTRKGFDKLPVIAMTAHTMAHEQEMSLAAGMNDHIGKPFDEAVFRQMLARWIPVAKHVAESPFDTVPGIDRSGPPRSGGTGKVLNWLAELKAITGLDTASGLTRFGGKAQRYAYWLNEFIEEGPATIAQLRRALAANQREAARQTLHAFKGRTGMLGMTEVHALASGLEARLKRNEPLQEGLLEHLERAVTALATRIAGALSGERGQGDRTTEAAATIEPGDPDCPLPEPIRRLIELLELGDGASPNAIEASLEALRGSVWEARLEQALALARRFDFSGARNTLLTGSNGEPDA
ncbi:MAG: DUF3365 domain-containing protein [Rhodocyclaceae bacterium]|nr:DUF3365 domain-containing protein [Rhodocyclaceae bacterium]